MQSKHWQGGNKQYLLHPNYEETTLSNCSVNITFTETKRDMLSMVCIYGTSSVLFALNIFPFQHGLLLWFLSHKSCYGHSPDNVCYGVSGYGLGLTVFALSKNDDVCFDSYWL